METNAIGRVTIHSNLPGAVSIETYCGGITINCIPCHFTSVLVSIIKFIIILLGRSKKTLE